MTVAVPSGSVCLVSLVFPYAFFLGDIAVIVDVGVRLSNYVASHTLKRDANSCAVSSLEAQSLVL